VAGASISHTNYVEAFLDRLLEKKPSTSTSKNNRYKKAASFIYEAASFEYYLLDVHFY
jgi:hypothetical protein